MLTDDDARARLAAHPLPANPWVVATDHTILIHAEYTDTIERLLRWAPKARWSARQRCWIVPLGSLELVRSILPELSRLAEAMQTRPMAAEASGGALPVDTATRDEAARKLFRDHARRLYGSDWQRETARALGRDEAALAGWLIGQGVLEAPPEALLAEMLALMRRRVTEIAAAADTLERQLVASGIAPPA